MNMKKICIKNKDYTDKAYSYIYGRIGLIPSENENFAEIADDLAVWRSLLEFVDFVIVASMAFSIIFSVFFGIYPIENISIHGKDAAVSVNKTVRNFEKGDAVIIKIDDRFYCAEFLNESGQHYITVKSGNDNILVSDDKIVGRAEFVFFPVSSFGEDARELCA